MRPAMIHRLAPLMALVLLTVVFVVGTHEHAEQSLRHPCLTCTLGATPVVAASVVVLAAPLSPVIETVARHHPVLISAPAPDAPLGRGPPRV